MEQDHNSSFAIIALFFLVGSFVLSGLFGVGGILMTCLVVYVLLCGTNAIDAGEKEARAKIREKQQKTK